MTSSTSPVNPAEPIVTALQRIRIVIADDQPLIRKMVRSILEQHLRFNVCGEAIDGADAVEMTEALRPDVVVMNISMPILDGFGATKEIRARIPDTAIIVLSTHADKQFIEEAKKLGLRGYVVKSKAGTDLEKAVDAAFAGEDFFIIE